MVATRALFGTCFCLAIAAAAGNAPAGAMPPGQGASAKAAAAGESICVTKYHDRNVNGSLSASEPKLAGWQFTVRNSADQVVATGVTNTSGLVCMHVTPGTFNVRETPKGGWWQSDPPVAAGRTVNVGTGQTRQVVFGNYQSRRPTQVCVEKYNDLDGDGVRDQGEPAMNGITFNLYRGTALIAVGVTAGRGIVCFTVPHGTYRVYEPPITGMTNTDPGNATRDKVVTIVTYQVAKLRFGNQ